MNATDGGVSTAEQATSAAVLPQNALGQPSAAPGPDAATPSTPVTDPIGGTRSSFADTQRRQTDQDALHLLAAELAGHLGAPPGSDPIGGTPNTFVERTVGVMDRLVQATAQTTVSDGGTSASTGPSALIHRALGLPLQASLPPDAATQLLRRITGLSDPYEITQAARYRAVLPAEQRTQMYSTSPDAGDPTVQATLADLTGTDQTPTSPVPLAAGLPPVVAIRFGPAMKTAITKVRRWVSGNPARYRPHTSEEGQLAHTIIGLHYLLSHADHPVILDMYAWSPAIGPALSLLTTLTQAAATGGPFSVVKTLLTSAVTSYTGRPDILDLATNEVYEIKPMRDMAEGAAQLADYLLRLNTGVLGTDALARALIAAITPTGIDPTKWTPPNADVRPFLPGSSWYPSQVYPLPDGRFMFVVRAVPGVIGYQIVGDDKADADGPSYTELTNRLWNAMAALAIIAAGALAASPGQDVPTTGVYPSPVNRLPINVDALRQAALATGAFATTGLLLITAADLIEVLAGLLLRLLMTAA